jgi:protein-S-isoprenylcysteine O-methyltransferase Ste14
MYLGMISALLGVAILLGTLGAFLPVPLFFFVLQRRFVQPEEKMLEQLFGERYREYRRRVRRWM